MQTGDLMALADVLYRILFFVLVADFVYRHVKAWRDKRNRFRWNYDHKKVWEYPYLSTDPKRCKHTVYRTKGTIQESNVQSAGEFRDCLSCGSSFFLPTKGEMQIAVGGLVGADKEQ